jgi:hypothetical protein
MRRHAATAFRDARTHHVSRMLALALDRKITILG